MNKRPVNTAKKSNIKCEHCEHYISAMQRVGYDYETGMCNIKLTPINYWNRCKQFKWNSKLNLLK